MSALIYPEIIGYKSGNLTAVSGFRVIRLSSALPHSMLAYFI